MAAEHHGGGPLSHQGFNCDDPHHRPLSRMLDYEQPVCVYFPEFAQNGKKRITVRQLLAHQAGLFAFDESVDKSVLTDLNRLAAVLARQRTYE